MEGRRLGCSAASAGLRKLRFTTGENGCGNESRCNLRCSKPDRQIAATRLPHFELLLTSGERLRIGKEADAAMLRMVLEAVRG